MDQTMEMGMGRMPNDQGDEQRLQMEKDKMKAMIDTMSADQLFAIGSVIEKLNEPPENEPAESGPEATALDWNEPRASADAKLAKMGM